MAKIAINGLGRIGRAALKIIMETPELELVAINDLVSPDNLAYLLKYDTVYGRYTRPVKVEDGALVIGTKRIKVFSEKDPAQLPWKNLGVQIALECTGVFTTKQGLEKHLQAGAQRAILSAPAKEVDLRTIVPGVNRAGKDDRMISTASCTTNCIVPVMEVLDRRIGIEKAMMTTIHAYTSSQKIVDTPSKKMRRGRAGAVNLVPTSTGAAKSAGQVLPQFVGNFDGVAIRAPIPVGSISDITCITKRATSVDEVNAIFTEESASDRYKGILGVTQDEIVSSDVIMDSRGSIVDLTMTNVVGGNLLKIMSWYDNEWGYASQMVREAVHFAKMGGAKEGEGVKGEKGERVAELTV